MTRSEPRLTLITQVEYLRLNSVVTGIVIGFLGGASLALATLYLVIKGGSVVGPHLALLGEFFIGYTVSVTGSAIGFCYGAALGFILGFTGSYLYNVLVSVFDG